MINSHFGFYNVMISYQDHNNVRRRLCFLMKVDWVQNESWVSGEKFCV